MTDHTELPKYDARRWRELSEAWHKKADRRRREPGRARKALNRAGARTGEIASNVGDFASEKTPRKLKDAGGLMVDKTFVPTMKAVIGLLDLINDWAVELHDPEVVIRAYRKRGLDVETVTDLGEVDLEHMDAYMRRFALQWRSFGSAEGAALGALAMIPVPVLGSAMAIGLDLVAMQVLTAAIATRAAYAYGFDAEDVEVRRLIDQLAAGSYMEQAPKAGTTAQAGAAFTAAKGRVNWSDKLRKDHRLMAAVEQMMQRLPGAGRVSVQQARMGMPVISVAVGAGTNAVILGNAAKRSCDYFALRRLSERHGLPMPAVDLVGADVHFEDQAQADELEKPLIGE